MAFEGELITEALFMTEINKSPIRYLPKINDTINLVNNTRNNVAIGLMCGNNGKEEVLLSVLNSSPINRKVYELDNRPILDVYSDPIEINRDGSISFLSRIYNNSYVEILELGKPMLILDETLDSIKKKIMSVQQ